MLSLDILPLAGVGNLFYRIHFFSNYLVKSVDILLKRCEKVLKKLRYRYVMFFENFCENAGVKFFENQ
jgi:hypothetical protein